MQDNGILKASRFFPSAENPDQTVREIKKWLEQKGVSSFDPVALFAEQLDKVRGPLVDAVSSIGV
jgi:hypothetical protein